MPLRAAAISRCGSSPRSKRAESAASPLIWAAARRGQVWAAYVLLVLSILSLVTTALNFTGDATPRWLNVLRPDTPPTTPEKIVDVVTLILEGVSFYFYFFGNRRTVSRT